MHSLATKPTRAAHTTPGRARRFGSLHPAPRLHPLARAVAAAGLLAAPLWLQASTTLPTGLQVVQGQASVAVQGAQMTVKNAGNAILNWQSFSIGAGAGVHFQQPGAASKVLNRVLGNDPSAIFGSLTSNGQVWLLNPNGVLFGAGARVDVAGLVTSTLRLNDNDFLAGRYRFSALDRDARSVVNEGSLTSSFGGQIVLLGERVENRGSIDAPGGSVALAAARSVELVDTGLPHLAVKVEVPQGEVLNLGRMAAAGGSVDIYGSIVNQSGFVMADALGSDAAGRVVLKASETLTLAAGSVTQASGAAQGGTVHLDSGAAGLTVVAGSANAASAQGVGGDMLVQGQRILLGGSSVLDVSGGSGGGLLRVGGDYQGRNASVRHAEMLTAQRGAVLRADAGVFGDGGRIIVWSDSATRFGGLVSARGGSAGGQGGFAEVSAKGYLDYQGSADLRAPLGRQGQLLLDPLNITIQASNPNLNGDGTPGDDLASAFLGFATFPGATSVITATALLSQLSTANVALQASNNIAVNADLVSGSNRSLSLQAGNNIDINANVFLSSSTALVLSANDAGGPASGSGRVFVNFPLQAGSIFITNGGGSGTHIFASDIQANTIDVNGSINLLAGNWTLSGFSTIANNIGGSGALVKNGAGTLELSAPNTYSGGTTVNAGELSVFSGNALGTGALTLNGGTLSTLAASNFGMPVVLGPSGGTVDTISAVATFNGVVSGSGALTLAGSGTLVMAGANTYSGGTAVSGGTLRLSGAAASAGTGTIALGFNSLDITGGAVVANAVTVSNGAAITSSSGSGTLAAGPALNLAGNTGLFLMSSAGTLAVDRVISSNDSSASVQIGGGTVVMSAASTQSGLTTISAGTLRLSGAIASPGIGGIVVGANTLDITNGASVDNLVFMSNGGSLASSSGNGTLSGIASLVLSDGTALNLSAGAGSTLTLAATIDEVGGSFGESVVVGGGTGTVRLVGVNSYTGSTTINAGRLEVAGNSALPDLAQVFVSAGAALGVLGTEAIGSLAGSGAVDLGGNVLNTGADNSNTTFSGVISGVGGGLLKAGIGTFTLAGANTYSGATSVGAGVLRLTGGSAVSDVAVLSVNNGAQVQLLSNERTGALAGGGGIDLGTNTLTAGDASSTTFSGVISGLGSLVKLGTGNLTLSGSNAYAGGTTVNAGNLILGSSLTSTSVQVNTGGTLRLGANELLPDGSTLVVSGGGVVDLNGNAETVSAVSLQNGSLLNGTLIAASNFDLREGTVSAVLAGSVGAVKSTAGNVTLTGQNTYTGATVIDGGTLNLNNLSPRTLSALQLNSGTLGGTGDLTVSGGFAMSNGNVLLTGAGSFTTNGPTTLNLGAQSNGQVTLQRAWTNNGTLTINGDDYLAIGSGGSLNNGATGVLNLDTTAPVPVAGIATGSSFANAGVINQANGRFHSFTVDTYNNAGSTNLGTGTLNIATATASGTDNGSYAVAAGGTLLVNNGSRVLSDGFSFSGAGDFEVGGTGALVLGNSSPLVLPRLTMTGGGLGGSGSLVISGAFNVTGGSVTLGGTGSLSTPGTSTINMASASGGQATVSKPWTNTGTLNLAGDDLIGIDASGGGSFTNASGGVINMSSTAGISIRAVSGAPTIGNAGTVNYNGSGNSTLQAGSFNNSGAVNVNSGVLAINGSGVDTGSYVTSASAVVAFTSGSRAINAGAAVSGAGRFEVSVGTVDINTALTPGALQFQTSGGTLNFNAGSPQTVSSLSITGGSVGGSGNLVVSGAFSVPGTNASLVGTGTLTTQGTGNVNLGSVTGGSLSVGKAWTNTGALSLAGDDSIVINGLAGGSLNNASGGVLNLGTSAAVAIGGGAGTTVLTNAGTLNHTLAGSHAITATSFSNSGLVDVSAGTLQVTSALLQNGGVHTASGATFETPSGWTNPVGSIISGSGTFAVGAGNTLTNQGTLRPATAGTAGTLSVTGNLSMAGAGTVQVDLGGTGAGNSDRVAVSGNAALGGTLSATLLGGYTPVNGDAIAVVTAAGASTGNFALTTLPPNFTAGYRLAAGEATRLIFSSTGGSFVFSNAAGNLDWSTPANWGGALPGSNDTALISSGFAVNHASGNDTIASLTISAANSLNVSGGSLTVTGATTLGGSLGTSGSGTLTLGGAVTGGAAIVTGGTLTFNGATTLGSLALSGGLLNGSGTLDVNGSFSRSGGATVGSGFSAVDLTQTAGDLIPGAWTAGRLDFRTASAGARMQVDAPLVATASSVTLSANAQMLVATGGSVAAAGNVVIGGGNTGIGGSVVGSNVFIAGSGGVQFSGGGGVTASQATGNAIAVDSGSGAFVNSVGPAVFGVGAGANWLVYSANPALNTLGGLVPAFKQYNAPFGAAPAAGGNGLLYALAPTLTATLQGTVDKVYDRNTTATLAPANYLVSGAQPGESVTLNNVTTGTYLTAGSGLTPQGAGTGKTVQATGLVATVTASGLPVFGYGFSGSASGVVGSITPLALVASGLSVLNKVYDGGTTATLAGGASVTPLAGDVVALSGTALGGFANKNVGSAKPVSLSGLSLVGADAANYTLTPPAGLVADITARPATVTGLSALNKVYDATTVATLTGTATANTVAGDAVALSGTALASFADKNVGSAKPVTVSGYALTGIDAANYSFTGPTGLVADITVRPLPVTGLTAAPKVYDATTAATLTGSAGVAPLAGDTVLLGGTATGSFANKNVGTAKPVTVGGLSLGGTDAPNYALTAPVGLVADITAAPLTLTGLAAAGKVYDTTTATTASAGLGGVRAGDVVSVGVTAAFADANAGVGKTVNYSAITAGADATNYILTGASGTTTATITPAVLTFTATPLTAPAGTALAPLTGTVAGFVAGQSLATATTGALTWTTAATLASPAGSYDISGGGLTAVNYSFVQAPANATALTLTPAATTVAATNATNTAINLGLQTVQVTLSMSTPTEGRVLDVTQAFAAPTQATTATAAGLTGDGGAAASSGSSATASGSAAPSTASGGEAAGSSTAAAAASGGTASSSATAAAAAPAFRAVNYSLLPRAEVQSLLAARDRYKKQVFSGSLFKLEQDPTLADVRPCQTEVDLGAGNCLITEALKNEIQAKAARAAGPRKPERRKPRQAALPNIERKIALLIGVNSYTDKRVPALEGAVPDARAVRKLFEERMGYEATVLENPTRESILRAFNKLALEADANDSVVIYYAGHGVVIPVAGVDTGFWLPSDTNAEDPASWLSNADIARLVGAVSARQLMLVSDSCYSGSLVGGEKVQLSQSSNAADLLSRKAAVVMSSGGNEPVADEGRDGHSVFAWHFMRAIEGLDQWQVGGSVFERVRAAVVKEFPQTPQYGAKRSAGHQGNTDFLFERREFDSLVPATPPAPR